MHKPPRWMIPELQLPASTGVLTIGKSLRFFAAALVAATSFVPLPAQDAAETGEARAFMEGDPCVEAGVMTAELRPYGLAILGK